MQRLIRAAEIGGVVQHEHRAAAAAARDRRRPRDERPSGVPRQGDFAAVDFDQFAAIADPELCKVGMLAQLADEDVLKFTAHVVDDTGNQIVSQWPGRLNAPNSALDAVRFGDRFDVLALDHGMISRLTLFVRYADPRLFHAFGLPLILPDDANPGNI